MFERSLIAIFLIAVVVIWGGVQISRVFFAYTDDAYVLSDYVNLAPTVRGPVAVLNVVDNDRVSAGDVLFEIDPRPYQFALDAAEAALVASQAMLKSAEDSLAVNRDRIKEAQANLDDAQETFDRISALFEDQVATEQRLEDVTQTLRDATATLNARRDAVIVAGDAVASAEAEVARSQAALERARYNLEQTQIIAPFSGFVPPFTIREGAYLRAGQEVIAVVDDQTWRVVSNVPEMHLAYIEVGQPVWMMISSMPWRVLKGEVLSIPRGISRSETAPDPLPYVEPTTSWIRLARRFPVEISIDDVAELPLFLGANARVLIWHPRRSIDEVEQPQ